MKREIVDEVIACLPTERTLFSYFKGQYALQIMGYVTQQLLSVADIKQSPYCKLLNQAEVKPLLATSGKGELSSELFMIPWRSEAQEFLLSVDRWGDNNRWDYQVTRPGCNLVLQLNLSEKHNRAYRRLVKPNEDALFNGYSHPVMKEHHPRFRETLAWARIDLDFTSGEALIEEIQSDWVRAVLLAYELTKQGRGSWRLKHCSCNEERFFAYVEKVFQPYVAIWAEAMLSSAIHFIREEIGIHNIFYHSYKSGGKLKDAEPPRSLYSDLPKRFCFVEVPQAPEFIEADKRYHRKKRAIGDVRFYQLAL